MSNEKYRPREDESVPPIPEHYPMEADNPWIDATEDEFKEHIRSRREIYDRTHCRHAKRNSQHELGAEKCKQCEDEKKQDLVP